MKKALSKLLDLLENAAGRLWKLLTDWDEWWFIPVMFYIILKAQEFLWSVDPEAGSYDIGKLQKVFLSMEAFLLMNFFIWMVFKLNHKSQYNNNSTEDYKNLTPWQRLFLRFSYRALYFVVLLLLMLVF